MRRFPQKRNFRVPKNSVDSPRSAERLMLVLDALSNAASRGLRLKDIVEVTGLGKTTAHRFINGLADQGLVDFDDETSKYFMGMKMLTWATAARKRFSLTRLAEPALQRLARKTHDTIYLVLKDADHAVCVDCIEGTHPIKVLTLSIGDRRPLGVGAGSLAILAGLPDLEVERILLQQRKEREQFAIEDDLLRIRLEEARQNKFSYNDVHVFRDLADVTGMAGVGVAIRRTDGQPVAALHMTTTTDRLKSPRREEMVELAFAEARALETDLAPLLDAPNPIIRPDDRGVDY